MHAFVVRRYLPFEDTAHTTGDEVVITNLGRTAAVIYDVSAITKDDEYLRSASMRRGYDSELIPFPDLPKSLAPGDVFTAWFSVSLAGEAAGRDFGYVVTYANTSTRSKSREEFAELVVKATHTPPPHRG